MNTTFLLSKPSSPLSPEARTTTTTSLHSVATCEISIASIFSAPSRSDGGLRLGGGEGEELDCGGKDDEIHGDETTLWLLVDEARERSTELESPMKAEKQSSLRKGAEKMLAVEILQADPHSRGS
ncbi:hypothetical protein Acr_00g0062900 [Actinidia rufa]|uniref:Uncharacterized protein n=1 Tax=Actinidia rufa TaxID=165716 RepID=A0A7J0DP41_9ERIC|nr:hypothetical protein Acr_00g0062900 [Actinidia rufa]